MGGYGFPVFESTHYIWYIHVNCSNEWSTFELDVYNKEKINKGIWENLKIRGSPWESEGANREIFKEFDKAVEELEHERDKVLNYLNYSKDEITLGEMYNQLKTTEQKLESITKRHDEMKLVFDKLKEIVNK